MSLRPDLEQQKEAIRQGSKSFAVASLFFSRRQKEAAWSLYSWCRYCDDEVDEVPADVARERLVSLRQQTRACAGPEQAPSFQFRGLQRVQQGYLIPSQYPLDLLKGMEMDVQGRHYETLAELEEYCYCVAGVVGLMMCHIMGVRSDRALPHAVAMGNAMQLTNICRDIREDFERGRIYLPRQWMESRGVDTADLMAPSQRWAIIEIQEKLLQRADQLYREGYAGLKYLSLRSSWAVLIAAKVYSHIGSRIRKDPERGLQKRIYVSFPRKLWLIGSTLSEFLPQVWHSLRLRQDVRVPGVIWSLK